MPYNYLKYLSRNIVFIAGFTLLWTVIFYFINGISSVFIAYAIFSILFIVLCYTHWKGWDILTSVLFIGVSDLTLLLADPGIYSSPMTGIGFLYAINLLYAFAFFIEEMDIAFYLTIFSTGVVFCVVNYSFVSPRLIDTIQSQVSGQTRIMIFGVTIMAFIFRLGVLLYEVGSHFLDDRMTHTESTTFFADFDEPICVLDRDLKLKRFNEAFRELYHRRYGIEPESGMIIYDMSQDIPILKAFERFLQRAFSGKHLREEYNVILEGVSYVYEISLYPIMNKIRQVDRVGLLYRDITARKKMEMDIVYTQNGLLEMMAHDLKAPLAMIKNINSLDKREGNQYNKFIDSTCIQANASIDNILAFSKYISSDSSGYKIENLARMLMTKVNAIKPTAKMSGQELVFEMSAESFFVKMNSDAFGRVIDNIISNAIKFTEGSGTIHIKIYQDGDNFVCVRISDQGIGIPEEIRDHLFERFSKAGRSGVNGEQSSGLGLYISNIIIRLHGGSIVLDQDQHKGTTFIIRLPLA